MTILTSQMSLFLLLLLSITTFHKTMCSNHTVVRCNEKDQETLLTFKQGINDSFGRISTWSTEKDCCAWRGVHCDNITGRVTKLDISYNQLEGSLSHCVYNMTQMNNDHVVCYDSIAIELVLVEGIMLVPDPALLSKSWI
ncbi:putative leucine-rich repeat-containing, plant-type, leucine-rich repeat domain, L [Medicago truncatula]|uniref:Putative leucine-rich repeat-containing, plant-type, leucine-rich repeat domain, L n=1 Tax=Medicago truncatula TaxID=3880 RepID=A0A396IN17_MEDTR|nr:putative leucine-rich repeat-containing, plant-type, leucine-rich repeat domain, L [Medicago truncatula]